MISLRAKTGFNQMLPRCLEESLRTEAHSTWQIQSITEPDQFKTQRFVMLTVSSYDFRLLVLLHFSENAASIKYVADRLKLAAADLPMPHYYDYLSEIGNNFCGAIKREMCQFYPHLGMSTPNHLGRASLVHAKSWPVEHESHVKAYTTDGFEFFGSLYVSAFGDLDFDLQMSVKQEESVEMGALELF